MTRTIPVRCLAPSRQGRLKPEMYATVSVELGETVERLVIPNTAVQHVGGESMVFVLEEGTRFRGRRVKLGRQMDSYTEVLEGVNPGEELVNRGSFLLKSELLKKRMVEE